jgi:nicotinamide-nucleotide amidase
MSGHNAPARVELQVEILVIGDELLNGTVTDTNSAWLGQRLAELGVRVRRRQVVVDTIDAIADALRLATRDADLVITSGGLGPTGDDLTADAGAAFLGVDLVVDEQAMRWIQAWRDRSGRMLGDIDGRQARLPAGATALENPVGTAPAFEYQAGDCRVISLPGVPRELRTLAGLYVLPWLAERVDVVPSVRTWKFFGPTESQLAVLVESLDTTGIDMHYRAHFPEIHLTALAADPARLDVFERDLMSRAGKHYFGGAGVELAAVVNQELAQSGLRIATAESCTGGLIAQLITSVPGSSAVFDHGVVAYANTVKEQVLGVPAELLAEYGAVSEPVVRAMAEGIRRISGSDIGVATSGIAGPGGGTPEKPVGTVHLAVSGPNGTTHRQFVYPFDRERVRKVSAWAALALVRRVISNQ